MISSVKKDSMLISVIISTEAAFSSTRISWISLHASLGRLRRRGTITIMSRIVFARRIDFSCDGSFTSCSSSTVHAAKISDWLNWCFSTS